MLASGCWGRSCFEEASVAAFWSKRAHQRPSPRSGRLERGFLPFSTVPTDLSFTLLAVLLPYGDLLSLCGLAACNPDPAPPPGQRGAIWAREQHRASPLHVDTYVHKHIWPRLMSPSALTTCASVLLRSHFSSAALSLGNQLGCHTSHAPYARPPATNHVRVEPIIVA